MIQRDLPYKQGLTWRNPSFLANDAVAYAAWDTALTDANDCDLFLLTFKVGDNKPLYEPVMKWYGGWRTMGPGRRFSQEEILLSDDLIGIEFIRGRF